MKGALVLLTVAIVSLVAGDGFAWDKTMFYKYKIEFKATNHSFDGSDMGTVTARLQMFIQPESDDLLIAKITDANIDKKYLQLLAAPVTQRSFMYTPISKPFKIHLKFGMIDAMSVDHRISNFELNILKIIVSQFQVDTMGRNAFRTEQTHLPVQGKNTAFFEKMEDTAAGKCKTVYDIAPIPDYLVETHREWIPMPDMKKSGEFIKIDKMRNFKMCQGRDSNYLLAIAADTNNWNVFQAMENFVNLSETRRIVISGNLHRFTFQSSHAVSKVVKGSNQTPVMSEFVTIKLESVEPARTDRMMRPQLDSRSLKHVDNLYYKFEFMDEDVEEATNLVYDKRFTRNCWTWHVWGGLACQLDFGRDWYYTGIKKNCDMGMNMGMRVMYECRRGAAY
jgi:hypothetical protein